MILLDAGKIKLTTLCCQVSFCYQTTIVSDCIDGGAWVEFRKETLASNNNNWSFVMTLDLRLPTPYPSLQNGNPLQ